MRLSLFVDVLVPHPHGAIYADPEGFVRGIQVQSLTFMGVGARVGVPTRISKKTCTQ